MTCTYETQKTATRENDNGRKKSMIVVKDKQIDS